MTPLEQLQQAREAYYAVDLAIWAKPSPSLNLARKVAYGLWLDAVRRFHAEGR